MIDRLIVRMTPLLSMFDSVHLGQSAKVYIKGVADVLRRTPRQGLVMSRDHIETVTLIGINPAAEMKRTAIRKKIIAGRFPRNN